MANITAASGEITLRGNWSQEALDAFVPVLDMWGFYNGVYGIHSCDNFTLTHLTSDFSGCGRWSFSDTLSSFEELTREWIKEKLQDWNGEPHQLTEEQYELFLKIMCDNELRIGIAFEDQDPATEFCGREIGELSSDGKSIKYKVLWCAEMDFVEEFEDWADEAKREARERKRKEAKMKKLPFDNVSSVTISSKAFVLTGEFEGYEGEKREKVQEMIVAKGGRCTRSVSGKTDYVVIGALGDFGEKKIEDVKTQRAKGSGTKLIRQSDLFCALFGASNEKTIDAGKPQNSTGKSASNDAPCKYITVNGVPAEGRRVELLPGVTVQLPYGAVYGESKEDGSFWGMPYLLPADYRDGPIKIAEDTEYQWKMSSFSEMFSFGVQLEADSVGTDIPSSARKAIIQQIINSIVDSNEDEEDEEAANGIHIKPELLENASFQLSPQTDRYSAGTGWRSTLNEQAEFLIVDGFCYPASNKVLGIILIDTGEKVNGYSALISARGKALNDFRWFDWFHFKWFDDTVGPTLKTIHYGLAPAKTSQNGTPSAPQKAVSGTTSNNSSQEQTKPLNQDNQSTGSEQEGTALASSIRSKTQSLKLEFDRRAKAQGKVLANGGYYGMSDPRLNRDLEAMDRIVNDCGAKGEKLLNDSLNTFNRIKGSLSAETASSVVSALENLIDTVDDNRAIERSIGLVSRYTWKTNIDSVKSSLRTSRTTQKAAVPEKKPATQKKTAASEKKPTAQKETAVPEKTPAAQKKPAFPAEDAAQKQKEQQEKAKAEKEKEEALKRKKAGLRKDIEQLYSHLRKLEQTKAEKERKLGSLGFFKWSEKGALRNEIDTLQKDIAATSMKLSELKIELSTSLIEYYNRPVPKNLREIVSTVTIALGSDAKHAKTVRELSDIANHSFSLYLTSLQISDAVHYIENVYSVRVPREMINENGDRRMVEEIAYFRNRKR